MLLGMVMMLVSLDIVLPINISLITINLLSILRRGNKATSSSNYFEDYNIIGMVPLTITKTLHDSCLKEDPSQGRVFQTSGSLSKLTELIKFDGTDFEVG